MTQGNYELQRLYLSGEQTRISAHLFELGVVSRLVGTVRPEAQRAPITGLDQLDKTFVPGVRNRKVGGETARVLSLVALAHAGERSRSFTYLDLGQLDDVGMLYPYSTVDVQDAEAVHGAARELMRAREEGILPDLSSTLLHVNNPLTSIRLLSE
jgi:hypothetical protein